MIRSISAIDFGVERWRTACQPAARAPSTRLPGVSDVSKSLHNERTTLNREGSSDFITSDAPQRIG